VAHWTPKAEEYTEAELIEEQLIFQTLNEEKRISGERRTQDREKGSCCNRRWKLCKHNQLLERERVIAVNEYRAMKRELTEEERVQVELEEKWQKREYERNFHYWEHNRGKH
jgi:hypothetical protein